MSLLRWAPRACPHRGASMQLASQGYAGGQLEFAPELLGAPQVARMSAGGRKGCRCRRLAFRVTISPTTSGRAARRRRTTHPPMRASRRSRSGLAATERRVRTRAAFGAAPARSTPWFSRPKSGAMPSSDPRSALGASGQPSSTVPAAARGLEEVNDFASSAPGRILRATAAGRAQRASRRPRSADGPVSGRRRTRPSTRRSTRARASMRARASTRARACTAPRIRRFGLLPRRGGHLGRTKTPVCGALAGTSAAPASHWRWGRGRCWACLPRRPGPDEGRRVIPTRFFAAVGSRALSFFGSR
mmetsp:Transcript_109128/g.314336  ORF Transcript_109128/g.314336 Transcript_109128/m.314336 type:complete len:303 (-) Transcript_109128:105-1013(-)